MSGQELKAGWGGKRSGGEVQQQGDQGEVRAEQCAVGALDLGGARVPPRGVEENKGGSQGVGSGECRRAGGWRREVGGGSGRLLYNPQDYGGRNGSLSNPHSLGRLP